MENEEKSVDVIVQEYEKKLQEQKDDYEKRLKDEQEKHNQEIRSIISGKKELQNPVGEEDEEEEKDFFTIEIEKTKKNLKLK